MSSARRRSSTVPVVLAHNLKTIDTTWASGRQESSPCWKRCIISSRMSRPRSAGHTPSTRRSLRAVRQLMACSMAVYTKTFGDTPQYDSHFSKVSRAMSSARRRSSTVPVVLAHNLKTIDTTWASGRQESSPCWKRCIISSRMSRPRSAGHTPSTRRSLRAVRQLMACSMPVYTKTFGDTP